MKHKMKPSLTIMLLMLFLFCRIPMADELKPQEIYKTALSATVSIATFDANGEIAGTGSGFFVRPNYIATNFHVVEGTTAEKLKAKLVDQKRVYPIKRIRAVDKKHDLAILQVSAPGVKPLPLGDSDAVEVGDEVYVVGNPLGLSGTFAPGHISRIWEQVPGGAGKTIQYTAPTSKGSSGGPALNNNGEVIGVHVAGLKKTPSGEIVQNINFAIPSNYLNALLVRHLGPAKPVKPKVTPKRPKPPKPVQPKPTTPKPTPQEIAKRALAATIHLVMFGANDEKWTGSGFFVRPNYIATNFHVIDGAVGGLAKRVGQETVYAIKSFTAKDKGHDLAILRVSAYGVEPLPLGDSDKVEIGDTIYAVGNPKRLEGTFSDGLISAIREKGEWGTGKRLQYTAPGARGSSGGPILNEKGEVIGIVVSGYEDLQNLNFAIPSNYLKNLVIQYLGSANPALPKVTPQKPKPTKPVQSKPATPNPTPQKPKSPEPVQPKPATPNPTPQKPEPTEPVKPKPATPNPTPQKPKSPEPVQPKPVSPIVTPKPAPSKPKPSRPLSPMELLQKGIKQYEDTQFTDAIKSLQSSLSGLGDPEQRARAHLYLGCSIWALGEDVNHVHREFQEALRHNPNQTLPPRIGDDHPVFKPLLKKVRSKSVGELTIVCSLPQTEIWIRGNPFERKMIGTGTTNIRLFMGDYTVEGIYEGEIQNRTVVIKPNEHEKIFLELPVIFKHDAPAKVSIGETIALTLDLISAVRPDRVEVRYTSFSRKGDELEQGNKEMRLLKEQPASSTRTYQAELSLQKDFGTVDYFIIADEARSPKTGHHRVLIEEDEQDRKEFEDALKEVEDNWKRIDDTNSATQLKINGLLDTTDAAIKSAESTANIHKFNRHQNTASEQINKAGESVDALVTSAPNDAQELDNLLISLSNTEVDAKANRRLSDSFIETTTTSLRDKIKGTKDTLYVLGDMQIRLDKQESQLANVVKEFKPLHQGIWASLWSNVVSKDETSTSEPGGGDMFSLIYLREGKTHRARGVQLDYSYQNPVNTSVTGLWEPDLDLRKLRENAMALTLLGGIARYDINSKRSDASQVESEESTHTTPIIGVGLQLYPEHRVTVDLKGKIKLQSANDGDRFINKHLYHYEVGVRLYIAPALNLRVGYGQWYLGNRDVTGLQIGLGALF